MKLLEINELGNGLTATINDETRQVAGDRYNVKVICLITLPVKDEYFVDLRDSSEMIDKVKNRIGDQLEFQILKERSFVDETAKDDLVTEMVEQINDTINSYVSSEKFPERMFLCRYDQIRTKVSVPEADIMSDIDDDDDGPADFSACFTDS